MPAITGSSLGYAGEINELTGKDYWNRIGASKFGVVGPDDLKVSTTTGDRMLLVGAGVAWGHNIMDTLQTSLSVQLSSVSSGSRWDMIVVRRDVTAGTSIEVVTGTSAKGLPSLTSTSASHPDQPLALCRVDANKTAVQEIVDLRCWAANGGVLAVDKLAQNYLAVPGAEVHIGGVDYRYKPDALGQFGWEERETLFREWNAVTTVTVSESANGTKSVGFPAGMFTVPPLVMATKQSGAMPKYIPYITNITTSGCLVGLYSGDASGNGGVNSIPVHIRAVQSAPTRAGGINP